MKRARTWRRLGLLVVALCLAVGTAGASPLLAIHGPQDWQDALAAGRIVEVTADKFAEMVRGDDQWPTEYRQAEFFTPDLEVIDRFEGEAGLYMAWGQPDGVEQRRAAAWDYVYGDEDPGLVGTRIEFSIFPPVPSTMVSLNLIDKYGNYREWIWHAGGPGELPPGQWSTLSIDPVTGTSNWPTFGGSPFIHNVPGSQFDLSSIQILRFNENIWSAPGFPPGPLGNVPDGWVWNMWDHVEVTPEPGTMLLLGAGLLGLARRRRRK